MLGLPGAGKTTLSSALAAHGDGLHLSAGQWLRERMAAGDQAIAGQLRDSVTMDKPRFLRFLRESLARQAGSPSLLIVDGAPRTPSQVTWLREAIEAEDDNATVTGIYLEVPPGKAMRRLSGRAPRHGDGNAAAPGRRIAAEEPALAPTLAAFRQHWPLLTVNASHSPAQVLSQAREMLALLRTAGSPV